MSSPESHINSFLRKLFPLTRRGILFFFISLIILITGLVRIELASLLWGSGFLLLILYAFIGNHVYRVIIGKYLQKQLDAVNCRLPVRGLSPGTEGIADMKIYLPRFAVPGFQVRFIHSLTWRNRIPIQLETDLFPGLNKKILEFRPKKRGYYKSSYANLEFMDLLGFTCGQKRVDLREKIKVYPSVVSPAEWMRRMESQGEDGEVSKSKQRSKDLLEVRKYFPGDDIRRINWKIYAHLNELFIRIGEETPPPESKFLVVLDTAPSNSIPEELSEDYLDSLIEACVSFINLLLIKGMQVTFAASGRGMKTWSIEKSKDMLSFLSELWWSDDHKIDFPLMKHLQVFLFSSPGSGALHETVSSLMSKGWDISLYLKELEAPSIAKQKLSLKNLLLVTENAGFKKKNRSKGLQKQVEDFNRTIDQEIAEFKNPPRRLKYVSKI